MARTKPASASLGDGIKLLELGFAVPQVMAHRMMRMVLAGPLPDARDRREFIGMVVEKQTAFAQAAIAAWMEGLRLQQQLWLSSMGGAPANELVARVQTAGVRAARKSLAPVHRKAVSNAKRLARPR